MNDHRIAAIVLAAGASRRMRGRDKLTELVDGIPLLHRVAGNAVESQASTVHVVLGARSDARREALGRLNVRTVLNRDWQSGMASSIRTGLESLGDETDGALIVLADMPDIDADLLNLLITMFDPERGLDIIRPRAASGPVGNPILFGKRHFPALLRLTGDTGAKSVIAANPDHIFDVPTMDNGVLTDLDTPEAWQKWQSDQEG